MDAPNNASNFEKIIYSFRFLTIIPVVGLLIGTVLMFIKGAYSVYNGAHAFYLEIISSTKSIASILYLIEAVDYFLFATVLFIISLGVYELFISKIDCAHCDDSSSESWLKISNLEDLKSYLGKVIIMILIVKFFKESFAVSYTTTMDMAMLSLCILIISLALFITKASHIKGNK